MLQPDRTNLQHLDVKPASDKLTSLFNNSIISADCLLPCVRPVAPIPTVQVDGSEVFAFWFENGSVPWLVLIALLALLIIHAALFTDFLSTLICHLLRCAALVRLFGKRLVEEFEARSVKVPPVRASARGAFLDRCSTFENLPNAIRTTITAR
mgnify:CR=1 FL=1